MACRVSIYRQDSCAMRHAPYIMQCVRLIEASHVSAWYQPGMRDRRQY
jgi:hypothetical protein